MWTDLDNQLVHTFGLVTSKCLVLVMSQHSLTNSKMCVSKKKQKQNKQQEQEKIGASRVHTISSQSPNEYIRSRFNHLNRFIPSVTDMGGNKIVSVMRDTIKLFLPVTIVIIPDILVTNVITKLY